MKLQSVLIDPESIIQALGRGETYQTIKDAEGNIIVGLSVEEIYLDYDKGERSVTLSISPYHKTFLIIGGMDI